MAVTLPRSTACSTAALMLTLGLAGTAMGQVTWQHQNVFTAPDIGDDGTCAPGSNYCWQGTGYYCTRSLGGATPSGSDSTRSAGRS